MKNIFLFYCNQKKDNTNSPESNKKYNLVFNS